MLCIHGYGEYAETFAGLEYFLQNQYTIIAIDMPLHGKTLWHKKDFSIENLLEIISIINPNKKEKISLLGYSMGGRIALQLLATKPLLFDEVVLLAPDGLVVNRWYKFSTQTLLGKAVFKATMHNPSWLFGFAKAMNKTRLLNDSLFKLMHYYMDNEAERKLLYDRWMMMRKFKPELQKIAQQIKDNHIKTSFVFGKYDKVIPPKNAATILSYNKAIEIVVLNAGHKLLQQKYIPEIVKLLIK